MRWLSLCLSASLSTQLKEDQKQLLVLKREARELRKAIEDALSGVVKGVKTTLVGIQPDKLA